MCLVDRSPNRAEIDAEIAGGLSLRQAAVKFGFTRSVMQRHGKDCLKLRPKDMSAEERKLARIRAERISGSLDEALAAAHELKERAQAKGDLQMEHKALKEIGRILSLEQQQSPKVGRELALTPARRFRAPEFTDKIIFPAECD